MTARFLVGRYARSSTPFMAFHGLSEVVHVRDNPVRAGLVRSQKTGRMLVKLPSRPTEKKKRAVIDRAYNLPHRRSQVCTWDSWPGGAMARSAKPSLLALQVSDPLVHVGVNRVVGLSEISRIEDRLPHVLGVVAPDSVGEDR